MMQTADGAVRVLGLLLVVWVPLLLGDSANEGTKQVSPSSSTSGTQPSPSEAPNETRPGIDDSVDYPLNPNHNGGNFLSSEMAKNLLIFGMFVLILVGGFFVVKYLRAERRKKIIRRYSRLKTSGTVADDGDEEIELSIYEKK